MDKANSLMRAFRRLGFDGWAIGAVAVAALVATPLIAVVIIAVAPSGDIWSHLSSTVLPLYIEKTLFLLLGVGVGTFVIGTGTAWLVTMCRFPGRWFFNWAPRWFGSWRLSRCMSFINFQWFLCWIFCWFLGWN